MKPNAFSKAASFLNSSSLPATGLGGSTPLIPVSAIFFRNQ
jgi:hypothetical protein